ncbi:putative mitochondrial saccharopine dehydrogenase-like oxidoreductase, partial [Cucurbita argyrosperma subsp. sororia]
MEASLYDFIILAASGFTGNRSESDKAVGNSQMGQLIPTPRRQFPLLTADISDPQSIHRLCTQTKLILNCAGLFRRYGEPVVAACVETGLESKNKIVANFGTFESAVLGVANADRLVQLRRSRPRRPRPTIPGCPPPKGPTVEHNTKRQAFGLKNGPSEDEVDSASFKMWFVGHGFSNNNGGGNRELDMKVVTRMMGPESGYVATSIILVQCAFVVLSKREILPKGGVLTPEVAVPKTKPSGNAARLRPPVSKTTPEKS